MDPQDVNVTEIMENANGSVEFNGMKIIQVIIASMGMITNIIVVIVFLNDRKLRRKIPNICIINQVGYSYFFTSSKLKCMKLRGFTLL